jgi:hypothetical protein
MRLFFILFLSLISFSFAGIASQKEEVNVFKKNSKTTFISSKSSTKYSAHFQYENESLEKDLIANPSLKLTIGYFILLAFLAFFTFRNQIPDSKTVIKRLKYNYWCLFKMLYPKHVFW